MEFSAEINAMSDARNAGNDGNVLLSANVGSSSAPAASPKTTPTFSMCRVYARCCLRQGKDDSSHGGVKSCDSFCRVAFQLQHIRLPPPTGLPQAAQHKVL